MDRKQKQRWRALQRGYACRVPVGFTQLLAPDTIASRARLQIAALALHDECNHAAGRPFHYLHDAIEAAALSRGPSKTKSARDLNHRAATARHEWHSDVVGCQHDLRSPATQTVLCLDSLLPATGSEQLDEILSFNLYHGGSDSEADDEKHYGSLTEGCGSTFGVSGTKAPSPEFGGTELSGGGDLLASDVDGDGPGGSSLSELFGAADGFEKDSDYDGLETGVLSSSHRANSDPPCLGVFDNDGIVAGSSDNEDVHVLRKLHDNDKESDYSGLPIKSVDFHKIVDLFDFEDPTADEDGAAFFHHLSYVGALHGKEVDLQSRGDSAVGEVGLPDHVHDKIEHDYDKDTHVRASWADCFDSEGSDFSSNEENGNEYENPLLHEKEADDTHGSSSSPSSRWELLDGIWTRTCGADGPVHGDTLAKVLDQDDGGLLHGLHEKEDNLHEDTFDDGLLHDFEADQFGGKIGDLCCEEHQPHPCLTQNQGQRWTDGMIQNSGIFVSLAREADMVALAMHVDLASPFDGGAMHDFPDSAHTLHEDDLHGLHDGDRCDFEPAKSQDMMGILHSNSLHEHANDHKKEYDAGTMHEETPFTNNGNLHDVPMVPFFIPCELVTASIHKSISRLTTRITLDGIYARRAKHELDEAHEQDRATYRSLMNTTKLAISNRQHCQAELATVKRKSEELVTALNNSILQWEDANKQWEDAAYNTKDLYVSSQRLLRNLLHISCPEAVNNQPCFGISYEPPLGHIRKLQKELEHMKDQFDRLKTVNSSLIQQLQELRHYQPDKAEVFEKNEAPQISKHEHDAQTPGKQQLAENSGNSGKNSETEQAWS